MRVEETGLRLRLPRPLLVAALVLAALLLPTWLWIVRGRKLPLAVVLDPPSYAATAKTRIPLRLRVRPADEDLVISWTGRGVRGDGLDAVWIAPDEPGVYTVSVRVRRAGAVAEDSVSLRVLEAPLESYPVLRPPRPETPPDGLPECRGRPAPRVRILGEPCRGANLVVAADKAGEGGVTWHWWKGRREQAVQGRMANLLVPMSGEGGEVTTLVVRGDPRCAWKLTTTVKPADCRADPAAPLHAAFSWQLVGPGHFRFAAKPPRAPGVSRVRYRWTFGGEPGARTEETAAPQISHRFGGDPTRWRIVGLEVNSSAGRARTARVVVDRLAGPGD